MLLAGEKEFGEGNTGTVKHRSRDHIISTLQLKSLSHTAMNMGLNCIVDKFLRFKSNSYISVIWILDFVVLSICLESGFFDYDFIFIMK